MKFAIEVANHPLDLAMGVFSRGRLMKKFLIRHLTLLFCVFLLVSCASDQQISVKDRWSDAIRNFALVPIYPMVEQVYIGDLRLFTDKSNPYGLSSRYIGHVEDVEVALLKKEIELPVNPKTKTAPIITDKSKIWPQPDDPIILPGLAVQPRLRMAALPNIALASVTEAEFGRGGISGLWSKIVGGRARSSATLNIAVSGVETLEIDDISAYNLTHEYLITKISSSGYKKGLCASAVSLGDPAGMQSNIAVVTRVFYARGIKYSYGKTFGATLRAAAGEGTRPSLPLQDTESPTPVANTETALEEPTPLAVDLSELASRTTPGQVRQIATVSSDTLTLEEVFERPMAFGVDVMVFPISKLKINCSSTENTVEVVERSQSTALTAPRNDQ